MIKNIKVSKVEDVNALNIITRKVKENPETNGLIVKFYADWCGHCLEMREDWDKLINELINNYKCKKPNCTLTIADIQVQTMDNKDQIMNNLKDVPKDIQGVPVIMFVLNGKRGEEYSDIRVYDKMLHWITNNKKFPIHKKSEKATTISADKKASSRSRSRSSNRKRMSTIKNQKNVDVVFTEPNRNVLDNIHREMRKHYKVRTVRNRIKTPAVFDNNK